MASRTGTVEVEGEERPYCVYSALEVEAYIGGSPRSVREAVDTMSCGMRVVSGRASEHGGAGVG